jgi:hypothetical protein
VFLFIANANRNGRNLLTWTKTRGSSKLIRNDFVLLRLRYVIGRTGYEELDVQKSKLITSGSKQGAGDQEYIAEWERKLKEKQRKKRPSRPPLENIYLAPNDRE